MHPRLRMVGQIAPQRGWRLDSHCHADFHELVLVRQGALQVETARGTEIARQGQVLFYQAGIAHAETALPGMFSSRFLAWYGTPMQSPWPVLVQDGAGRLAMLMHWLWDRQVAGHASDDPTSQALMTALVDELRRLRGGVEDEMVKHIRTYVQAHLAEDLTVAGLARIVAQSRAHFSRRFRQATKESPAAFVRRQRVEAARALLLTTPLPLRAIAAQVGLGDEFQLSRVFKRVMGCPPSSLRSGRDEG